MAGSRLQSRNITSPVVRISYPAFFVPTAVRNADGTEGKKSYGCTGIFDKRGQELTQKIGLDFNALMAELVKEVNLHAKSKWPEEFATAKPPFMRDSVLKSPWLNPKDPKYRDRPEMKEAITFIRPSSNRKIAAVDRQKTPITDAEDIYPGCYARLVVACYTWGPFMGGNGVSFGLRAVQFIAHGDRLDGGVDTSEAFGALDDPDDDAFGASATQTGGDEAAQLAALFGG